MTRIAFCGVGTMGRHLVRHLVAAGHDVRLIGTGLAEAFLALRRGESASFVPLRPSPASAPAR